MVVRCRSFAGGVDKVVNKWRRKQATIKFIEAVNTLLREAIRGREKQEE